MSSNKGRRTLGGVEGSVMRRRRLERVGGSARPLWKQDKQAGRKEHAMKTQHPWGLLAAFYCSHSVIF